MNPALRRLGFAPGDRVAVVHADDLGLCVSTAPAFQDLLEAGLVRSGSLMPVCPDFQETAERLKELREADFGAHLTLTSEWPGQRWRPLSRNGSLTGGSGWLHRDMASLTHTAAPSEAESEMRAQIKAVRSAGLEISHADSHMMAGLHCELLEGYVRAACSEGLTPMLARNRSELTPRSKRRIHRWEAAGLPVFDHIALSPLKDPRDRLEWAVNAFRSLPAGLTLLLAHPARPSRALQTIAEDWRGRVADWKAFSSRRLVNAVRDEGITIADYSLLGGCANGL